jgi:hypothetical protein
MSVNWTEVVVEALFGSLGTAVLGSIAYLIERSKIERIALLELERNLSERRAFRIDDLVVVRHAKRKPDFDRVASSIVSARRAIQEARAALVRKKRAQEVLTRMIVACNVYLEQSEKDADRYHFLLANLRDRLHSDLSQIVPKGRPALRPGDRSLPEAVGPRP